MSSTQNTNNNEINTNEASRFTAIKDQALGAIKETIGSVLGNEKMQLEGRAQKVHGHNEYQFAKAYKEGEVEPENFQQAYHTDASAEHLDSNVQNQTTHPAPVSGQAPPPPLEYAQPIPTAPVQPVETTHSSAEPSQMSGMKDQAIGSLKQTMGNATNNPSMEIAGKAQSIHGHNEAEFAKARKEGRDEPEHFEHGTKTTDHAEGKVEGDKVSSLSAVKDKAMGSIKETFGSATGNTNTELAGKAQQMHGRNEAEFAKAEKRGLDEPEHYAHGTKTVDHAQGEVEGQNVSTLGAIKDKAMGSVKEMLGSATGNQNMELKGKAQNIHGRNEAEFAKAQKQGLTEPEHFAQGTKATDHAEGKVEGEKASSLTAMKDKAMGSIKETIGSATGNTNTELAGKAQQMHGRNESEFVKAQKEGRSEPEHYAHGTNSIDRSERFETEPSKMSAWKDQAVGALKETLGSATSNQNMELKGKAQNIHGRNEAEFAKAQKDGHSEPEHFAQGTKATDHAQGKVEGENVSSMSAMKDKALGSIKETFGSATGNTNTELAGKAQQMHGRNEAEFVKAQNEGRAEPEHYSHGTKTTEHAHGQVVAAEPSKMTGWKDQAVGAVKESFGSATNNQNLEIEGKAQKMQGSTECNLADSQKKTSLNA